MALIPSILIEVLNDGTLLKISDTTVYGDGIVDPSRANSLVNFDVFSMRGGSTDIKTNQYDPSTVTEMLQDINADGWYQVKITITQNPIGGGLFASYSYQTIVDTIVSDRFCRCKANYLYKLTEKPCGCEDSKVWENLFCMEGQFLGIQRLVEKNDMLSADMAIERLELECNELNAECGCH